MVARLCKLNYRNHILFVILDVPAIQTRPLYPLAHAFVTFPSAIASGKMDTRAGALKPYLIIREGVVAMKHLIELAELLATIILMVTVQVIIRG